MSQRSFASAEYAMKKKRTRREKFLAEMERLVPWSRLIAVIEPLYPKSGRAGRQPIGVPEPVASGRHRHGTPDGPLLPQPAGQTFGWRQTDVQGSGPS